jgi:hypothetical protein
VSKPSFSAADGATPPNATNHIKPPSTSSPARRRLLPCPPLRAVSLRVGPIFLAIKRHNQAWNAFEVAYLPTDGVLAEQRAFERLINLPPTPGAGIRAASNCVMEF